MQVCNNWGKNQLSYREMRTEKPDWKGILCFDGTRGGKWSSRHEGFFHAAKFPTCPIEKILLFCDLYQKADCRKCICKRIRATITVWNGHLNSPKLHHVIPTCHDPYLGISDISKARGDNERRQKTLHSYHINSKGNIKLKNNILYKMFARLLSEDFSLHSPCKSVAQPNALDSFILLWS